ncbi:hypothetical protein SCP_0404010 [Sparassis crispa]|uniref:MARVEL domain-containing protein n=1 Tax=Sparassis crispa TaxID=139825 RepID=A0A401GIU3_9APHY|nr:hypothetical protein SCP_0404010 [Sparassis crispa]GBE82025.1 hypothetical protein SCP_0404010 [Sparassis crispa]
MASLLISYRYFTFVLYIVCAVIILGVSAWSLNLAQAALQTAVVQVDIYLICVNAPGVLIIFPILFLDIFRRNALTSRIWFECIWVAISSLLLLAGAVAVSATTSTVVCHSLPLTPSLDLCTSLRVLVAFTWIGAVNFLAYFCVFANAVVRHHQDDPDIWQASIPDYPWFIVRASLGSAPVSPSKAEGKVDRKSFKLRPDPILQTEFSKRMVTRPQYDVEKQLPRSAPSPIGPSPMRLQQQLPRTAAMLSFVPLSARGKPPAPPPPTSPSVPAIQVVAPSPSQVPTASAATVAAAPQPSTPLSASRNRLLRKGKRSLHLHRPPPLDLTLATSYQPTFQQPQQSAG